MRKWAVIAVIGAALICLAVFVFSEIFGKPRRGSADYHRDEFSKAWSGGPFRSWIGSAPGTFERIYLRSLSNRMEFHRSALVAAGYLERKEFVTSNVPAATVAKTLHTETFEGCIFLGFNKFAQFGAVAPNRLSVVGEPIMIRQWQEVIQKLDAPAESGK